MPEDERLAAGDGEADDGERAADEPTQQRDVGREELRRAEDERPADDEEEPPPSSPPVDC